MKTVSSLVRRHALTLCALLGASILFSACHDDHGPYHHVYNDYHHGHDHHYDRDYDQSDYGHHAVYVEPSTHRSNVVVTPAVTVTHERSYSY